MTIDISKELEKNLQELQKENSDLKNDLGNLQQKIKDFKLSLESNKVLIGRLNTQNNDLKENLEQKAKKISLLTEENSDKSREVELLNSEYKKATSLRQDSENRLNKLMKESGDMNTEKEIFLRQIEEFRLTIKELKEKTSVLIEGKNHFQSKREDLEEDIVELRKKLGLKELKLQRTKNDIKIEKESLLEQIRELKEYKEKTSVVLEQLVKFLEEDDDRIQILRVSRNATGKTFTSLANELSKSLPKIRVLVESLSKYECVKVEHDKVIFKRFPWDIVD